MLKRFVALTAIATVGLGAGALAWAEAGPGTASRPTLEASVASAVSPDGQAGAKRAALKDLRESIRKADHGTLDVKGDDGSFHTVTFDRGSVIAVSATSITLDRPDGKQVTLTVGSDTRFVGVASAADVKTGKPAVVVSRDGAATVVAQRAKDDAPAA